MDYIQNFDYHDLWNKYNVIWHHLNKDVNILVGINGKGKTTLLNAINEYYNSKPGKNNSKHIEATPLDCPVVYIQSADVPSDVKKKKTLNCWRICCVWYCRMGNKSLSLTIVCAL